MHEAHSRQNEPSVEDRTRALEALLTERGLISTDELDEYLRWMESDIGPLLGARVVARAWIDQSFKKRLLTDAGDAVAELGIDYPGHRLVVVESTSTVHNVVCCTLCSCYPWRVLGLPPTWYKSAAYRSRVVIDPRGVLAEFGLRVPDETEVRVWDSTSECRYMVLPMRPAGTENYSEAELTELISRDALVGVATVPSPVA